MAGGGQGRPTTVASVLSAHPYLLSVGLIAFIGLGVGPNYVLAALSFAVLFAGVSLLWRPGETPILLFIFGYQWMQGSILIFLANLRGLPIGAVWDTVGDVRTATLLTQIGLFVFAIGMRIGAGRPRPEQGRTAWAQARQRPLDTWFWIYIAAALVGIVAEVAARLVPGLSQPLLALAGLKWAFFYMLAYRAVVARQILHPLFLLAFAIELLSGIGGYFSDFKTVFLVTILAAVATNRRVSPQAAAGMGLIVAVMMVFAVVWSTIKMEYRDYVSGGEKAQVVSVDYGARISKLGELISNLDGKQLEHGEELLVQRISYVVFFGAVLDYVPEFVPHENGAIYLDAIARPFMPRILFPQKTVVDDSVRTGQYTGLNIAGGDQGVSISLGWIAESYIDFGKYLMFVGIIAVGVLYGAINKFFAGGRVVSPLLGDALSTAVLFFAAALESSLTKVIGAVAVSFLVALILKYWLLPYWQPWLLNRAKRDRPGPVR